MYFGFSSLGQPCPKRPHQPLHSLCLHPSPIIGRQRLCSYNGGKEIRHSLGHWEPEVQLTTIQGSGETATDEMVHGSRLWRSTEQTPLTKYILRYMGGRGSLKNSRQLKQSIHPLSSYAMCGFVCLHWPQTHKVNHQSRAEKIVPQGSVEDKEGQPM